MASKLEKFAEANNPWPKHPVMLYALWYKKGFLNSEDTVEVHDGEFFYDTAVNRRCMTFVLTKTGVAAFHEASQILPLIGGPNHGEMGALCQPSVAKNYRLIYGYGNHPKLKGQQGFLIYKPLYREAHDNLVKQRGLEPNNEYPIL